jgi:uncharacterized protein YabE (DUF348 family)
MSIIFKNKSRGFFFFSGIFAIGLFLFLNFSAKGANSFSGQDTKEKKIHFSDEGISFNVVSKARNVQEFLDEQKIKLFPNDAVYPTKDEKIFSGTKIIIQRAKKIIIKEGGNTTEKYTLQKTVEEAVWENKDISFSDDDITKPERASLVEDGMTIVVTHVLIKEETVNENIAFKTVTNEDDELGWRIKKVTQKGENGIREVKSRVVYYDGKEISRKVLERNVIKDPIDEVVTQGTFVKVGKVHTGAASWYAYTGELCAANPWLPMGSYVRVTNQDNGKSVIVKINDRGPFGNGRIIDLDKVAFAKIASLGAGVANVKMEVITN